MQRHTQNHKGKNACYFKIKIYIKATSDRIDQLLQGVGNLDRLESTKFLKTI